MNKKIDKTEKKAEIKEVKKVETKKVSSFKKKKKIKRSITSGIAYVYSTFNNTIISIADENGNVVSWSQLEQKVLKAQENLHHMQLKSPLMTREQKLLSKAFER